MKHGLKKWIVITENIDTMFPTFTIGVPAAAKAKAIAVEAINCIFGRYDGPSINRKVVTALDDDIVYIELDDNRSITVTRVRG